MSEEASRTSEEGLRPRRMLAAVAALGLLYLALLAATLWLLPGREVPLAAAGVLLAALVVLSAIDAATYTLPDLITLPLTAAGLVATWLLEADRAPSALAGAACGYALIRVIDEAYLRLRGRRGIGGGDAKLLAAGGAWTGLAGLPTILLWACLSALLELLVARARAREIDAGTRIAFGPHLAIGIWLTWLLGALH